MNYNYEPSDWYENPQYDSSDKDEFDWEKYNDEKTAYQLDELMD